MTTPQNTGRYLSDKIKSWHITLMVAIVIGLSTVQWFLNKKEDEIKETKFVVEMESTPPVSR